MAKAASLWKEMLDRHGDGLLVLPLFHVAPVALARVFENCPCRTPNLSTAVLAKLILLARLTRVQKNVALC